MINLKNHYKKIKEVMLLAALDLAAVVISMTLGMLIVDMCVTFTIHLLYWFLINLVVVYLFFALFKMYFIVFTAVGIIDTLRALCAILCVLSINICSCLFLDAPVGYRVVCTYCIILFTLSLLIRFSQRIYIAVRYSIRRKNKNKIRALIVGGGNAGTMLIREIQTTDKIDYIPVCVVDDDSAKLYKNISGVKILGTTEDIPRLVVKYAIDEILIAIPAASRNDLKRIYGICEKTKCKVKTLPGIYQIVKGDASVTSLRPVEIADLLGRDQIKVNLDEIMGYIENNVVLVTGGGGSIGSELCRQIAIHNPKQLIILDIYENNAYDIEQELRRRHPELNLLALIASVRDVGKMEDVFKKYKPDIVFNAAAHKHVPLMETSPNEAVKNNVFGTYNVAKCADKFKSKVFVQISTDKAVNPTNIMGATKRICEMIIQTIGKYSKNTKFVAVRFGNVLGSNGSVIPLFEKQIKEGGPVTVTHKDIIRYFMTIPEAVSLVLQAGAYAKGGQIFVLDMGEPVRIYDLAVNLIKLSGLEPDVDIEIKCTGLRPGEKLFEERLMDEEGMQKTDNGLINIANPIQLDEEHLWSSLDKLKKAAYEETDEMKRLVAGLVTTYKPQ
ncbi:MAG: polysaccharide biosynthesis protein [Clostridia bacterium]|nr:polysaccharide biosynthesis protein [Clostridia bacterium]